MKTNRLFCLVLAVVLVAVGCRKKPTATTTPLHQAARAGDIQHIQSLISGGGDVNAKDKDEWTPLHWAAHKGHTEAAKLLITNGTNVNAKDEDGWTALFLVPYICGGRR